MVGTFTVAFSTQLVDLSGLYNLTSISAQLTIFGNTQLVNASLPALKSVGTGVYVSGNPKLQLLGPFTSLQTVGTSFTVQVGPSLCVHVLASCEGRARVTPPVRAHALVASRVRR